MNALPTTPSGQLLTDRASFIDAVSRELRQADASSIAALLVLRLERADRIGALLHEAGALAIGQQLLQRTRGVLRDSDLLLEVDVDEYWLFLPRLRVAALATLAVNRLLGVLQTAFDDDASSAAIAPRIGVALAPLHGQDPARLLRAADQAQLAARSANLTYALAGVGDNTLVLRDARDAALRAVMSDNALTVAYQPKVDLGSGRVGSVEALVRWPLGVQPAMSATLIIETAERCGLLDAVTQHVLHTVLRERNGWRQQGIEMTVWVNLSVRLLSQPHLPQLLLQILQIWQTPPEAIGFEITESELARDLEQTAAALIALRAVGFHLSIDDFGTGYASMAYLRRFPISELKIDRMFVQDMTRSPHDHQIVSSIISLAHSFGLVVVAEGAEESVTVDQLRALGCDFVQGYVYAEPMPATDLPGWLADFQT
ncbi:MAG: GGDEF domain-containing phosphodiesterase [Pseudomonadota bacterium]|nr:GGDEF domain-containing phosphodiesterase [Pseudomonadota bacterium]